MTAAGTDAEDQPGVLIQGLESEGEVTRDNNLLSKFRLDGTQSAPHGAREIEVAFNIDAKQVLNTSGQDKVHRRTAGAAAAQKPTADSSGGEGEKGWKREERGTRGGKERDWG